MAPPLPRRQSELLGRSPGLSLHFDHGYAGYDATWAHTKADQKKGIEEGKTAFLRSFVSRFNDPNEYAPFLIRRDEAMALEQNAKSVLATSSAPLLAGLGRWNPAEIGFNLDRFTGCPFIPGSSVKGLLREAARLVAANELPAPEAAVTYWEGSLPKVFGRGAGEKPAGGGEEEAGTIRFFDAYPVEWPRLELDVMTPHYADYYGAPNAVAADWEDPLPVHFLRVAAKTTFRFWFASRRHGGADAAALNEVAALLPVALDWIGIGAKTSSGYGWFGSQDGAYGAVRTAPTKPEPTPAPRLEWTAARLRYERGNGTLWADHGTQSAHAKGKDLEAAVTGVLLSRLRDKKQKPPATATVVVEEFGRGLKIVEVRDERG
jgi:CRISPR-associated protein Cmr6